MLKIILSRTGKKKQAYFKILVTQKEKDPWGKYLENLGNYNPRSKQLEINADRVKHWIDQGAQPSATIWNMLVDKGLVEGKKKKVSVISKKRSTKIAEKDKTAKEAEAAAASAVEAKPEAKAEEPKAAVKPEEPKVEASVKIEEPKKEEKTEAPKKEEKGGQKEEEGKDGVEPNAEAKPEETKKE